MKLALWAFAVALAFAANIPPGSTQEDDVREVGEVGTGPVEEHVYKPKEPEHKEPERKEPIYKPKEPEHKEPKHKEPIYKPEEPEHKEPYEKPKKPAKEPVYPPLTSPHPIEYPTKPHEIYPKPEEGSKQESYSSEIESSSSSVDSEEWVGVWKEWSDWSRCSATCGTGVETRVRECEGKRKLFYGLPEPKKDIYPGKFGPGPVQIIPKEHKELPYPKKEEDKPEEEKPEEEKPEEETYPGDKHSRKRRQIYAAEEEEEFGNIEGFGDEETGVHSYGSPSGPPYDCDGSKYETRPCREKACPINGHWSEWAEWSVCSVTCGDGGLSTRTRKCDNPHPENGGKICKGTYIEHRLCSVTKSCPIHGHWSEWTEWTSCSVSCGFGGTIQRERSCNRPEAAFGGEPCLGEAREVRDCCKEPCPINGNWGPWTPWSAPSVTCGLGGVINRTRSCDNPEPQFGGKPCEGLEYSVNTIHLPPCPINGEWSNWGSWGECSITCGKGGFRQRSRACDHPAPLNGGHYCLGESFLAESCDRPPCAIPGGWSNWYGWSSCSATCGFGKLVRKRFCDHPKPAYGGPQCEGEETDSKICFLRVCPINGGWSAWTEFVFNSVTCGEGGIKTRYRECDNPEPEYGGKPCVGDKVDVVPVELPFCPIPGGWASWSAWSIPSQSCGEDVVSVRRRVCTNPVPANGGANCRGEDFEVKTYNLVPCPICGGWSVWREWSECSKTCGTGGITSRSRECTNPVPSYGGYPCSGEPSQTKGCSRHPCAVNGGWSNWGEWSQCSLTCGDDGNQKRVRNCDYPEPAYNGQPCDGSGLETKQCTAPACAVNGGWTAWSPWSPCSETCGQSALVIRARSCTSPEPQYGGHFCQHSPVEVKNITLKPCPINGGWTCWTPWSQCSISCGDGGSQTRARECISPRPQYSGHHCKGDAKESRYCATKPCVVNGNWGPWSEFTKCSVTCGDGGIKTRLRECDRPAPVYGGEYCPGNTSETIACSSEPCRINGEWGEWTSWSETSKTCGEHLVVKRTRNCDHPTPIHGGEPCEGESSETRYVDLKPCPINGGWTSWTGWNQCSVSCGSGGITKRVRYCEEPAPLFDGHRCEGEGEETRSCEGPQCPVEGGWCEWSPWSKCTVSCGEGGWINRVRTCTHPEPAYGGKNCHGHATETVPGSAPPCPVEGGWGSWSRWSECSVTCGLGGSRSRSRACDNPPPAFHGKPCNTDSTESKNCSAPACPINGEWSNWSEWSRCSVTCGEGHEERTRLCDNPAPRYGGNDCKDDAREVKKCVAEHCPLHGGWSSWSQWSEKSVTCGHGAVSVRRRKCDNPIPEHGGFNCHGVHFEVRNVTNLPCLINGGWSKWCEWSKCSITCGTGGVRKRSRSCTHPTPSAFGKQCVGDDEENKSCHEKPCPIQGGWTVWSAWSTCTVTCGEDGVQERKRLCENPRPAHGGHPCDGEDRETIGCTARPCSINGGWTTWSSWAPCSVTCGDKGVTSRNRACTNPTPEYSGKNCLGLNYEQKNCSAEECPINGGWSEWSEWADCSQTCGYGGTTTRERKCTEPEPDFGGANCLGLASEKKYCFVAPCDNWTPWSEWSVCVEKCGVDAYQRRTRDCNLPVKPDTYGKFIDEWCEGERIETRSCSKPFDFEEKVVPVDIDDCGKCRAACVHNEIVVFERSSPELNFNRSWAEYREGFGSPESHNFVLGLDKLSCLTKSGKCHVRVEEKTVSDVWYYGAFKSIVVESESENFRLSLESYEGTTSGASDLVGQQFSTFDRDNDQSTYSNCALINGGGWWYKNCYKVLYTGDYEKHFEDKDLETLNVDTHLKYARITIGCEPVFDEDEGDEETKTVQTNDQLIKPADEGIHKSYDKPPASAVSEVSE